MFNDVVSHVRALYGSEDFIPLHEPRLLGNEKKYVVETIDSTFVSSVGKFVDRFEEMFAEYTGARYAIATVNGTAALHLALMLAGVESGDEVITQPLTFVATCNAIRYCNADPIFIDVDKDTLGLSPEKLKSWLEFNAIVQDGVCVNRHTNKVIRACVPMHTFGHPANIAELLQICDSYNIQLVEDAAESLGSYYSGTHTGTESRVAAFSFNGNKTITTGGGGMVITNDEQLARKAKHITTTAKLPHKWEYVHDQIAYNYRLPNINAALGCAQLEQLESFLSLKRQVADSYESFFQESSITFVSESEGCKSNYWLNAVILDSLEQRDAFLEHTNNAGVMTRPIWRLMSRLPMFSECQSGCLENSIWLEERLVNIPSSVPLR